MSERKGLRNHLWSSHEFESVKRQLGPLKLSIHFVNVPRMILSGSLKHPTHEAPYTYMPFRHSPQNCVGMRFSLLEIIVTLVRLPRKYKLERTKETAAS